MNPGRTTAHEPAKTHALVAPIDGLTLGSRLLRCGVGGVESLTGRTTVEGGRGPEMVHPVHPVHPSSSPFIRRIQYLHPSLHSAYTTSLQVMNDYTQPCPPIIAHLTIYAIALQQSVDNHIPICRLRPQNVTPPTRPSSSLTRPRSKLRARQPGTAGLVFFFGR